MSKLYRHIDFLKAVLLYTIAAFGGPQGHLGMMLRIFVERRKDITEEELLELNAFSQMLPGPSSTQTIMLIGYKRGGPTLAIMTLLIWVLPAAILMGAFSFLITYLNIQSIKTTVFHYIHPMTIGFVVYAALKMMEKSVTNLATWIIMIVCALLTLTFHNPWIIPIMFVLSGLITNLSNKRIPEKTEPRKKLKWINIRIYIAVFILVGALSEVARLSNWEFRRIFNLSENFYRFGSLVYGGGQALLPMMFFQFVTRPLSIGKTPFLSSSELITGFGMVQAIPGPVFAVCAYVGGMSMNNFGAGWQILGGLISITAVFLPSTLLLLFFYPIYQNLKQHAIIYRALEGINAMIVGIVWASGILFSMDILHISKNNLFRFSWIHNIDLLSILVLAGTYCALRYTKLPPPVLVAAALILGYFWG
ncbi:chromate transporter [Taibaiella sp. KBW10]|uniref:chromate efflux transporter n=1 Tax=Taibaiella sp. KBW10 TaxID=2153357 RepID=UPI000F59853F|nr:chromate efflux transporter [Taibaiella sp. KBW10]RQO30038.1 chromate transporter [Taibaiella sp. KBW10]